MQYHFEQTSLDTPVLVVGDTGGRIDQAFSLFNYLYHHIDSSVFLYTGEGISFLLKQGENILHLQKDIFGENCGIIPLLGKTIMTTKGLEWNLGMCAIIIKSN